MNVKQAVIFAFILQGIALLPSPSYKMVLVEALLILLTMPILYYLINQKIIQNNKNICKQRFLANGNQCDLFMVDSNDRVFCMDYQNRNILLADTKSIFLVQLNLDENIKDVIPRFNSGGSQLQFNIKVKNNPKFILKFLKDPHAANDLFHQIKQI
ncbi:MAG: hypothetical protein GY729_15565 [Desulfobacteraceae bacterium]|nr:hypothetical protein [Desulfobacteraceae bacterium]